MGCVGCPDCATCPNCCTTTPPCPGGAHCAGFFAAVLRAIGAPASANNVAILQTWARYENTRAGWNPLATTLVWGTYSWWNCAPNWVKCYASEADGIAATARTLLLPEYPAIVAALRRDAPITEWACAPIPAEVGVWGTGGFAAYLRSLSCSTPTPTPTPTPVPPPPPPAGGGGFVPLALIVGGVGLAAWAIRRDPSLRRRVGAEAGAVERRLRGGAPASFGGRARTRSLEERALRRCVRRR